MKKLIFTLLISCFTFVGYANHEAASLQSPKGLNPSDFPAEIMNMDMDDFLSLTPKKYKEITGEKLGVQNTLKLKAAQKMLKKQNKKDSDISKGVYILLAILGLGFLAIGLLDDWEGNEWIIALVLAILCWIPGVIYALVKMKDYY